MTTKVLICHSSADIYYCIALYEKFSRDFKIIMLAVNNYQNYKFLSSLNLKDAEIIYIPYPSRGFFYFFSFLYHRLFYAYFFHKKLKKVQGGEFYFFSTVFDYVAFYFVNRLASGNQGYIVDHYLLVKENDQKLNFKHLLNLAIFSFLADKRLQYEFYNGKPILAYGFGQENFKKYPVESLRIDLTLYKQKTVRPGKKAILLFESNDIQTHFTAEKEKYQKVIENVVEMAFKKDFLVYIKPHPRLGCSPFIKSMKIQFLEDYIPGEFIYYEGFNLILGGSSKVIANMSKDFPEIVYSLIDLLPFDTQDTREYYRSYLLRSSDEKLRFLRNLDELAQRLE
jgi:hypothetical protein